MAVKVAVLVVMVVVLSGICISAALKRKGKVNQEEASRNARSLSLAFYTFKEDYGSYPCEETAIEVRNNTETTAKLGKVSSNDFCRQLIASGMVDQEPPFYARTLGSRKPDNVTTGDKLLEKGELGFAYVVSHAACKEKNFPLLLTPMVKGKLQFDYESARKCFDGKVLVLMTDCSRHIHIVDKDGHVWINGKDFFDPSQPYWHGIPPKVAWPE